MSRLDECAEAALEMYEPARTLQPTAEPLCGRRAAWPRRSGFVTMSEPTGSSLSRHRPELLRFARSVAEAALSVPGSARVERPTIVGQFGGVFVTFWSGWGHGSEPPTGRAAVLRGCVGTLAPTRHLVDSIEAVTRGSLGDQRFTRNPISASELEVLTIELSILSDLKPTGDPASLVPGTHGIVIRRGNRSGCFLPRVAVERSWSAEEFLSQCCTMKAGLPADAWRSPEAEVLLFTAEVFSEAATA